MSGNSPIDGGHMVGLGVNHNCPIDDPLDKEHLKTLFSATLLKTVSTNQNANIQKLGVTG